MGPPDGLGGLDEFTDPVGISVAGRLVHPDRPRRGEPPPDVAGESDRARLVGCDLKGWGGISLWEPLGPSCCSLRVMVSCLSGESKPHSEGVPNSGDVGENWGDVGEYLGDGGDGGDGGDDMLARKLGAEKATDVFEAGRY